MAILDDGEGEAGAVAAPAAEAARALEAIPAVIRAAAHHVDLLEGVLADVAGSQHAGREVEGHAPGVAQAVGPDLRAGAARRHERVAGGTA